MTETATKRELINVFVPGGPSPASSDAGEWRIERRAHRLNERFDE